MPPPLTFHPGIPETRSTVTSKGQITIPLAVRKSLTIKPGDQVVFRVEKTAGEERATLSRASTLTLEETFASVHPLRRPEDFKKLRELALDDKAEKELVKMQQEA